MDCLLLWICHARRWRLFTNTMTAKSTGRPHRQISVSRTCSRSMKIRIKIRLHMSVIVLMIPFESRSLKLFT